MSDSTVPSQHAPEPSGPSQSMANQPEPGAPGYPQPTPPPPPGPRQPEPGSQFSLGAPPAMAPPGVVPPPMSQAGAFPPPMAPAAQPTAKKRSPMLIGGIVAGVVILLCCGIGTMAAMVGGDSEPGASVVSGASAGASTDAAPGGATPAAPATPAQPTKQPAPKPTTFDLPAGSTLVVKTPEGTVEVTIKSFRTSAGACDKYGVKPKEGMYLIADVSVKITEGTGSINPFFFKWVADDGTTADGVSGAFGGCGKPLDSGNDMRTGTLRAGQLVFDVRDTKGVVEYASSIIDTASGSWRP